MSYSSLYGAQPKFVIGEIVDVISDTGNSSCVLEDTIVLEVIPVPLSGSLFAYLVAGNGGDTYIPEHFLRKKHKDEPCTWGDCIFQPTRESD